MKSVLRTGLLLVTAPLLGSCVADIPASAFPDGIQREDMDLSADPGKDFYQYANGGWLARNTIPPEYSSWGAGREVMERNQAILRKILEEDAASPGEPGSVSQLIGDFYASGMDTERIAELGSHPLEPWLARIDAIRDLEDLLAALPDLQLDGVSAFFGLEVEADLTDSTTKIAFLAQDGMGLPEKGYYLREDEESVTLREKYRQHVAKMLTLIGEDPADAAADAATVLRLETALAQKSFGAMDFRDPQKLANKMPFADADALLPHVSLAAWCKGLGVAPQVLNVIAPDYWPEVDRLLQSEPIADWKAYLRWHLVHSMAPGLSPEFTRESWDFYAHTLSGAEKMQPRWKRVLRMVSGSLGEALGQEYVKRAFPPEAKDRAERMVEDLLWAMESRIRKVDWMSDATRAKALEKLAAFHYKIGYPDKWKTYEELVIRRDDYLGNLVRAERYETRRELNKIDQPVDRTEWGMTPQMVNAYYNPLLNEVVFPAGILQPPFFGPQADDAVNYGSMGAVIGHEITHGFDDSGAQFGPDGNLEMWWTEEDFAEFNRRGEELAKQFDAYEIAPGVHVNGKLTLGENIADLGGLHIAYLAYHHHVGDRPQARVDGFTPDQRFFLAFARSWRAKKRLEALKLQVNTDPHAPARFRAIGPIGNLREFARAFGLDETAPMVRSAADRVEIW